MTHAELIELLIDAENDRDLLFLETVKLKEEIARLEKQISNIEPTK